MVQLLSFDTSLATPIMLLAGFIVYRLRDDSRYESIGCALIGLGLMLLALGLPRCNPEPHGGHLGVSTGYASLDGDLIIAVVAAVLLTWLCHSSVAVVLLIASPGWRTG